MPRGCWILPATYPCHRQQDNRQDRGSVTHRIKLCAVSKMYVDIPVGVCYHICAHILWRYHGKGVMEMAERGKKVTSPKIASLAGRALQSTHSSATTKRLAA